MILMIYLCKSKGNYPILILFENIIGRKQLNYKVRRVKTKVSFSPDQCVMKTFARVLALQY